MIPAKIWGCTYIGKIGSYYCYRPTLGYTAPLGGYFKFKKFPTAEKVRAIFVNVMSFKYLVE